MKTIKQIADGLGVPKQRVYRFIKANRINEAHQDHGASYYDNAAESYITSHFSAHAASGDVHQGASNITIDTPNDAVVGALVAMLQRELDAKNQQIAELSAALVAAHQAASTAQALHAITMKHQTDNEPRLGFFARLFHKPMKMS